MRHERSSNRQLLLIRTSCSHYTLDRRQCGAVLSRRLAKADAHAAIAFSFSSIVDPLATFDAAFVILASKAASEAVALSNELS